MTLSGLRDIIQLTQHLPPDTLVMVQVEDGTEVLESFTTDFDEEGLVWTLVLSSQSSLADKHEGLK